MYLKEMLRNKEKEEKLEGKLTSIVNNVVEQVRPILDRIPIIFKEYTPHDISHSERIINRMSEFVPDDVLDNMNVWEIYLLILSAYLHDVGMAVSEDEKNGIIKSEDYRQFREDNYVKELELIEKFRNENNQAAIDFYENSIFIEYIRKNHHTRSYDYILKNFEGENGLKIDDEEHAIAVAKICKAHGLPVSELENKEFDKRYAFEGKFVNLQFLIICLRLGDILDADKKRTPKILKEFINPKNPKSKAEWERHISTKSIALSDKEIKFSGTCHSDKYHRELLKYIRRVDNERKELMNLLKEYPEKISSKYFLNLKDNVEENIESDGSYILKNFKFSLENEKIFRLLLGTSLYHEKTVCLRELLQNSIDACRCREFKESKHSKYIGKISFKLLRKKIDNRQIRKIIVEDNGIGMDDFVIENFFMKIGKSYYQSHFFKKEKIPFSPISVFGVGILSCFMLADKIEVDTYKLGKEPRKLEIENHLDYFTTRMGTRKELGTTITLYLKDDIKIDIINEIRKYARHVEFPIEVISGEKKETIVDPGYNFEFQDFLNPLKRKYVDEINPYIIDLENEKIKGLEGKFAIFLLKGKDSAYSFNSDNLNISRSHREFLLGTEQYFSEIQENQEILSQDGILVRSEMGLFRMFDSIIPRWLKGKYVFFDINLESESKVDLTLSRNLIVLNDKFENIYRIIECIVLEKIANLFSLIEDRRNKNIYIENFFEHFFQPHQYNQSKLFLDFMRDQGSFRCYINAKKEYLKYSELKEQYGKYFYIRFYSDDKKEKKRIKRFFEYIIKLQQKIPVVTTEYVTEYLPNILEKQTKEHNIITSKDVGFSFDEFVLGEPKTKINDNKIGFTFKGDYRDKAFTYSEAGFGLIPNLSHSFIKLINKNQNKLTEEDKKLHKFFIDQILQMRMSDFSISFGKIDLAELVKRQRSLLNFYIEKKLLAKEETEAFILSKKDLCPYDVYHPKKSKKSK